MWFNGFMMWLLNSPIHWPVSRKLIVLTFTGRKSGKSYTIPVEYVQEGDTLTFITQRQRVWWKNLREGAPVTVHLRGHDVQGYARVLDDSPETSRAGIDKVYAFLPQRSRDKMPQDAVVIEIALLPAESGAHAQHA
jgi:deazaflavin-dependent oxidoreductase (nitroreductase family)